MIYLKWIGWRFIFFRRVLVTFFDRLIYQKESQFLLHKINAHRCPYDAILFYNTLGRTLFAFKEFVALLSNNKIFKKSINIDGFDEKIDYMKLYEKGSSAILYPKSPMVEKVETQIDDAYYEKIANSFVMAYSHDGEEKDISSEWERISAEFREIFFDENNKIIKEKLENFRSDPAIYSKIFNNQYPYIEPAGEYKATYLKAIDLVLEYHRFASKIDKEMMASLSESRAGNYLSINYRGKKLSEQLLQNMVVASDLIKHVPLLENQKSVVLDIGVGFGGSSRILHYYRPHATQIVLDLPETLFLTAYYLKYNFPDKKIALLEDIYPHLDRFDELVEEYDFLVIPPFVLDHISAKSVDLVVNASSLAFMSKEYLDYYLKETNRVLKDGGYFYSLNTTEDSEWGIGSHNWDYQADYLTVMYNYDNRFSYPQWLGKKYRG